MAESRRTGKFLSLWGKVCPDEEEWILRSKQEKKEMGGVFRKCEAMRSYNSLKYSNSPPPPYLGFFYEFGGLFVSSSKKVIVH
jgi:hypothetical protein